MKRRLSHLLLLLALLLASVAAPSLAAADNPCTDCVHSVSTPPSYVGALLIPGGSQSDPPDLPSTAGHCIGCAWWLQPACRTAVGPGDGMCAGAAASCPPGQIRLAVILQRLTDPGPVRVGTFCYVGGTPLSPTELVPGVRDRFLRLLPSLAPSFAPAGGGLVNLPVVFASGEPRTLGRHAFALGPFGIVLDATARWHWEFGDGQGGDYASPGGPYPDLSVSHGYTGAGTYPVQVTASWAGDFWVDGLGPFQVTGPAITQTSNIVVPVREAGAVLVGVTGMNVRPPPA